MSWSFNTLRNSQGIGCVVLDLDNSCIIEGNRSSNNCYFLARPNTSLNTRVNDTELWHQRLEHISYISLKDTVAAKAVCGIPEPSIEPEKICGLCQLGKQARASHKVSQHTSTARVLDLVHVTPYEI